MRKISSISKDIDSKVFIWIRYCSFILSSFVSALLNIFLFSSLDKSYTWLLIMMSITLESTKIGSLTMRNCFASIYEKVKLASIKAKQHLFLFFYILLAILSITAGLGFSLTITAKTEATNSLALTTMQAQYAALTEQIEKIDSKNLEMSELNKSTGISIDSYEPFILANQKYQEAEAAYIQANTAYRSALGDRTGLEEGTEQYVIASNLINKTNQALSAATTARSLTKSESERIKANFNDFQSNSETVLLRLNEDIKTLNEELNLLISQCGLESQIGSVALLELDNNIRLEQNKHIIEKGMGYMFEEFARYFHTTPEIVKLFILLFVAFLIELTIYSTGPDIKITRRVLYFFRNSLPADANVQEIIEKFETENNKFSNMKLNIEEPLKEDIKIETPIEPVKKRKQRLGRGIEALITGQPEQEKPKRKYNRKPKNVVEDLVSKEDLVVTESNPEEEFEDNFLKSITDTIPSNLDIIDKITIDRVNEQVSEEAKAIEEFFKTNEKKEVESEPSDLLKHQEEHKENSQIGKPQDIFRFRFGRSSMLIKDTIVSFIKECCSEEPGQFKMSPSDAASKLNINDRSRDVFLDKLSKVIKDRKPIIATDGFNNWFSNFDLNSIIDYISEIIS